MPTTPDIGFLYDCVCMTVLAITECFRKAATHISLYLPDLLTTNGQHQLGARSFMILRDVFCSHHFAVILIVRCIRWICTKLCHQRNLQVDITCLSDPLTTSAIHAYCKFNSTIVLRVTQTICLLPLKPAALSSTGPCSLVLGTVAGQMGIEI